MNNNEQPYKKKKKNRNVVPGVILIFIGLGIFWPGLFSTIFFKIIIALSLIWAGLKLIFNDK